MRIWLAASLLAFVPSHAFAMPSAEFIARWKAVSFMPKDQLPGGADMNAAAKAVMAKPEFKLLVAEFSNAVDRYKASVLASRKAGKPRACPPSGLETTIDGLIVDIQRLPAGWQTRELAETLAEAMDRRYPCVATPTGQAVVSDKGSIDILPGAQRRPVPVVRLHGLATFEGRVNGEAGTMLVDNGFDRTTLDVAFARRLGLKLGPPTYELRTGRSVMKASMTEVATVDVPHMGTMKGSWLVVDLTGMSKLAGQPIDAILGNDIIGQLALTISSGPRSWMRLHPSGTVRPKENTGQLSLPIVNVGEVEAAINGEAVRLKIDLGYTGFINLTETAWRRIFGSGERAVPTGTVTTVDGKVHRTHTLTATLKMGALTIDKAPIDSGGSSASYDGLLGAAFLLQGSMLLDQPAKLLSVILKPDPAAKPTVPVPAAP